MSEHPDAQEWAALRRATRVFLQPGGAKAAALLAALRAYDRHTIDPGIPTVCKEIGHQPGDADYVLLLALSRMTAAEITRAHATGAMPDRDALETLAALSGRPVPPRPVNPPKRRKQRVVP